MSDKSMIKETLLKADVVAGEKSIPEVEEKLVQIKKELERVRTELNVFYDITQALRTTLRLDEIFYIILTGITAHQGFGFNRAMLFLLDERNNVIKGVMGIGPLSHREAEKIWDFIETQKIDLYGLIGAYNNIKNSSEKPPLFEVTASFSLPYNQGQGGYLYTALHTGEVVHVAAEEARRSGEDNLIKTFHLEEFVIVPLRAKDTVIGAILADNYVLRNPIADEDIKSLGMFANQAGMAIENSKIYEETLLRSHKDSLTNLWNHGYFQYKLDEELLKVGTQGVMLSLMLVDIDEFKKYNDTYGHQIGDLALKQIAELIIKNSRGTDIACRYGGEEFVIIMLNTSKKDAVVNAERLRQAVEKYIFAPSHRLTISIGIASSPQDSLEKEGLIKKSDLCLYKAKQEGRNRVIYSIV